MKSLNFSIWLPALMRRETPAAQVGARDRQIISNMTDTMSLER